MASNLSSLSFLALTILLVTNGANSAIQPLAVPRDAVHKFFNEGVFEGGRRSKANLVSISMEEKSKGFERWVFDFEPSARSTRPMPKFQIRYVKGDGPSDSDSDSPSNRPKLILTFQTIEQNRLKKAQIQTLLKQSQYVGDIVTYPTVDEGDMALELILRENILFSPRQPLDPSGRLILDLKHS